ncbi:hypothetical protein AB833_28285 [Chromatiales bacterium (ex Bugula neritina AB1)]|nr:hypothetical protein AB833_28285 [Chromatiales bacterium (ex Bugula neritina AB1)]
MKITITRKETTGSFESNTEEPLLFAGLRQGAGLEYECATGTCGTCRAKLVSGELDQGWAEAPGRLLIKVKRGEFLMCQARALSDCDIRVPGKQALFSGGKGLPDHFSGTLHSITALTADVLKFKVQLQNPMTFQPGQFVVLQSPHVNAYRAYSMTNSDEATSELDFVIKKLPDGGFSSWIFEQTEAVSAVKVFGPLGKAVFEPALKKDILCIAGGSGIAGMLSILSAGCRDNYFADHKAHVFFGVRTEADIFFKEELSEIARQFPDTIKVTIALSEQHGPVHLPGLADNFVITDGFVHLAARETELSKENTMAYIAGPPPMVDGALKDLIGQAGYAPDQIRFDKFG